MSSIRIPDFTKGPETTMLEFLQTDISQNGMLIIDEIETSLHPRAQRRLIRALAEICRERQAQIILTTHSPYILDELPLEARMYILGRGDYRQIVSGVSANFAMTDMDDETHPDCELYVEDERALGRDYSQVADACAMAMTHDDHHVWVGAAGNTLLVPGAHLWQAMCSVWANDLLRTMPK